MNQPTGSGAPTIGNSTPGGTTTYTPSVTQNLDDSGQQTGAQTTVYAQNSAATPITPPVTPVDTTKAFNASSIATTTPTTYPPASTANTTAANTQLGATTGAAAITAGAAANPDTTNTEASTTTPAATSTNSRQGVLDSILGIFKQQQGESADTDAANQQNDVAGKMQKVTDLNSQLASTSQSYDNQIAAVQKNLSGASAQYVQGQVDNITRQKNADLANISIQLNAANGNYTTAAAIAKQTVDAKYAPLKDELATLQQYYQLSSNDMTDSEKQQAQAQIDAKQKAVDAQTQKDLAAYQEQLQESDPLHAAQVAEAWANVNKTNATTATLQGGGQVDANGNPIQNPKGTGGFDASGTPTTAAAAAASSNSNDQQAFALATGLAAPSQYITARNATTPAGKALIDRANAISMATLGVPFNPAASEAAFKFRNSTQYQKLTNNAPVAIQTIVQAAQAAKDLNLTDVQSLNSFKVNALAGGYWPGGNQQQQSDAQTLKSFLALNQDDLGLILGSGSGSDYKSKLAGLIFDASGAPLATSDLANSMVNKITDKLGQYYTSAGIPNGKAFAQQTAQDLVNSATQDGNVQIPDSSGTGGSTTVTDQYASYRSQVPAGDILVNRNGQIGSIPADEFDSSTDTKL